jgi:enoyl-CoA hydratase
MGFREYLIGKKYRLPTDKDRCQFSCQEYTQLMETSAAISDLLARLNSPSEAERMSAILDQPYLLLDLSNWQPDPDESGAGGAKDGWPLQPNCPVIALSDKDADLPPIVDVIAASEAELQILTEAIGQNPVAATVLVQLLRHNERASVEDALFAESLAYSSLQSGVSFKTWLNSRKTPNSAAEDESSLVLMDRQQELLTITLNRPHKRNAYSAALRDALCEALCLVAEDKTIERAIVQGAGVCFSAGGDLDEFGEATDGAFAHLVRMTRSTASLLDRLKERVEFRLHGACVGAGIELPAFSKHVVAAGDSFFQLPEVAFGLVPGAGGTVSVLGRIGRHRTAFMALSNQRIDAETALKWGLIDAIE